MTAWSERANPFWPYRWVARLRNGGRVAQYDVDGYHGSDELNSPVPMAGAIFAHGARAGVTPGEVAALELHGHPAGILTVPARADPPMRVVIRTRTDRVLARGGRQWVRRFLGFQYATGFVGLEVDDAGRVSRHGR